MLIHRACWHITSQKPHGIQQSLPIKKMQLHYVIEKDNIKYNLTFRVKKQTAFQLQIDIELQSLKTIIHYLTEKLQFCI